MAKAGVLLGEVAEKRDVSIHADGTFREALSIMHRNGKGVVVVLEGPQPLGILTERDAVRLLYSGTRKSEKVGPLATTPLIVTSGKRSIGYALGLIVENKIRRLVVVDDEGSFTGVVTQQDLLEHMEDDLYRSALKVRHILNHVKVLCGSSGDETVRDVLRKMVEGNISAVPVVRGSKAVGIITEKDILRLADEDTDLLESVSSHMSSPVLTATYETRLIDIVRTMQEKNIRRMVIDDDKGQAVGMLTSRDLVRNIEVSYNEFLERKLSSSKDILNLLPEMFFEMVDTGPEVLVVWVNDQVLSLLGRTMIDRPVTELIPPADWKKIYAMLADQGKVEHVRFKKDDRVYEASGFFVAVDKEGEKGRIQLILKDITEEVMLASIDPLTSLYNRRYISEFMANETGRAKRTGRNFAVVMLDVDDFKKVNDTYGHPVGDHVLKGIVRIMKASTREYDVIGRYGGEEFLVIMPEVDLKTVLQVTERIRGGIAEEVFEPGNGARLSVTASFGAALYKEDGDSPDALLLKADERLYSAKRQGKNRVVAS
jgi:diguanylate cyclase (GGDEF)-like protein